MFLNKLLTLLLLVYLVLILPTLFHNPRIWPDEAVFAEIAGNIMRLGNTGVNLWGDMYIGVKEHVYYYPPFYLFSLSAIFKIFGLSIESQRVFSVILGGLFLITFYFLIKEILKSYPPIFKKLATLGILILTITDNIFLRGARIGRPEVLILFLSALSFYLLFKAINKHEKSTNTRYFLIGIIIGLALISHLLSFVFFLTMIITLLFKYKLNILKIKSFQFLFVGYLFPLIIWLISIFPNYYIFFKQVSLVGRVRLLLESHVQSVFQYGSIEEKLIHSIYIALIIAFVLFAIFKRKLENLFLAILLILLSLVAWFGKLEWYSIYIIPYLYLAFAILIYNFSNPGKKLGIFSLIIISGVTVLFILNLKLYYGSYQSLKKEQQAYLKFSQQARKIIPEGTTVYLSTIPDLYYEFKDRNYIYEFPPAHPHPRYNEYIKNLDRTDYIIVNFHYEAMFVGGLLSRYIDINKQLEYVIGEPDMYQAQVIKLVPKDERMMP